MDVIAQVVFADIRGFTRWAEDTEVFANLEEFAGQFQVIVETNFPQAKLVKPLGDGSMIVHELGRQPSTPTSAELDALLQSIAQVNEQFRRLCHDFAGRIGHATDLVLGWGVVRGKVKKFKKDYVGPNVNKAARLCDQARPYGGIVIDRDDFHVQPTPREFKFYPQVRKLTGIGDVRVWVTEEVANQFLTRERLRQEPEVHVAGVCVDARDRRGPKILIAKRSEARRLFPGKIEGCGGQLGRSETFAEGVQRHFRLEMGLEVRVVEDIHRFYVIRQPNEIVIPGIRFLCERVSTREPESVNHDWIRWVTEEELRNLPGSDFVNGLREEMLLLLDQYKQKQGH